MRNIVLIVDDVEVNRDILAMILEEEYPIIEAENGRVAVELMEKHQDEIAVVLLDLIMPEYDGYAVLETMNERNWINIMPVLVISAEAKGEVEQRCLDLGVSDFIRKPFNAMLRKRVKNIVDLFLYRNQLEEKVEEQTITLKKQNKQLQGKQYQDHRYPGYRGGVPEPGEWGAYQEGEGLYPDPGRTDAEGLSGIWTYR